jgi:alkylation response protein AidB-like acyl-CoA dehydrogenase
MELPEETVALRSEVRSFLDSEHSHLTRRNSDFGSGHDPEFSRKLGAKGWIGMGAGAPVGAHWIADRQSGPLLLRFGTEAQREKYIPPITRGESYFSIGMSEPNSGSDLASVRTTASKVADGWVVNGTKLWSTDAHRNNYMIALVRTEPPSENRHAGLSQVIIDLHDDGAQIRPIKNIAGHEDFNEVVFEDVLIPEDRLVGEPGNGWEQVTSELAYERAGPERFLSSFRVFVELVRAVGKDPLPHEADAIGRIASHLMALRRMSISVAGMLEAGKSPQVEAALVKELGNNFEKLLPEIARLAAPDGLSGDEERLRSFRSTFTDTLLGSPSFTIRGGTREILRGVIARGLGLR